MTLPDPDHIRDIIQSVAQEEILPRFRALRAEEVRTKSHPMDLVTDADVEAEKALSRRLPDALPGSVIVGEEAVHADPAVLDRLAGDAPVWVVDPVDGTSNFAHGKPMFATIVALVSGGRTVMGWLHDPLRGATIIAEAGSGTWLNGQRLHVAGQGQRLADLLGSAGYLPAKPLRGKYRKNLHHASAAHDYMALVEGRMHFAVFRRLMPWDHAAGVLAHQEAGGFAGLSSGEPYTPLLRAGSLVLTPDEAVHREIRALIAPKP